MAYRAAVCDDSAADADYVRGIVAHWAEQRMRTMCAASWRTGQSSGASRWNAGPFPQRNSSYSATQRIKTLIYYCWM